MMEIKLWAALCALLLVHFGSADHDNGHTAPSSPSESGGGGAAAPPTGSVLTSNQSSINYTATTPSLDGSDTNSSSEVSGSLSSNTSTDNGTDVSHSDAAGSEKNQTEQAPPQPSVPPSVSLTPTSHISLTSTTTSPTSTAHADTVDISPTTTPPTNTSDPNASNHTAPPKILSFTSAPTPETTKSEATTTTTTTTTTIPQSSSTSSTSSSQKSNSEPPMLTPPPNTSQPDRRPETSSADHKISSTTSQAVAHAKTPSQLNVGGDTTMVHDSPTLDPLLAGLVSAFIITAVIITLLLFLKLRRRDNRPEFRRLQDLPMDDMMEDTPLSMYSY